MNQKRYLSALKSHLKPLGRSGTQPIIAEIKTLISDSNCPDDQLLERFGTPEELAARYLEDAPAAPPSLLGRVTRGFLYTVGILFVLLLLAGYFIYQFFMADRFNYADMSVPELSVQSGTWHHHTLDAAATINVKQATLAIYWHDEETLSYQCEREDEIKVGDEFHILRDHCLLYLPKVPVSLTSRQAQIVLVQPGADLSMSTEMTSLRIAANGAEFKLEANKRESKVEHVGQSESANVLISVDAYQTSVTPYEY